MTRITENTIEEFAIELMERLGYQYIYAPDIAHDASISSATGRLERDFYEEVLLTERLQNAIRRINPKVLIDSQEEAFKDEYIKLLKKFEIKYDEKHLFEWND